MSDVGSVMAGHTPGPWRIEGTRGPQFIISAGTNAEGDGPADYVGVLGPMFAAPTRDDALLVCAAPELLKAARRALAVLKATNGNTGQPGNVLRALQTAIAKAEGES